MKHHYHYQRCGPIIWSVLSLLAIAGFRVDPVPFILINDSRATATASRSEPKGDAPSARTDVSSKTAYERSIEAPFKPLKAIAQWSCNRRSVGDTPQRGFKVQGPCPEPRMLNFVLARRVAATDAGTIKVPGPFRDVQPLNSRETAKNVSQMWSWDALDITSILLALQGLATSHAEDVSWDT